MTEIIMRLRRCAEELSQIADAMTKFGSLASAIDAEELERRVGPDARRVVEALALFGVNAKVERVCQGPTVNKIELSLPPGCRYSSVTNLIDNLQGALRKHSLRIEAPIPGSDAVGLEYDRPDPEPVTFNETTLLEIARLDSLRKRPNLPVVVGKNVCCAAVSFDLAAMPHLLVGGAPGQGAAMFVHSLINGLIASRSPEEVRMLLFDPIGVEFAVYANLPHLVVPVLNESLRLVVALKWAVAEMDKRLRFFATFCARNIDEYNNRNITSDEQSKDIPERVPHIVIVLGELAGVMQQCGRSVTHDIAQLTARARVAGIHLVLATQQLGPDVVTGSIKVNVPGLVAFKTANSKDSRVLLDDKGAERLIGKGDCLFRDQNGVLQRVQVPCISDAEIDSNVERAIAKYSKKEYAFKPPTVFEDDGDSLSADYARPARMTLDQLVEKAKTVIRETGRASTSHFQRQLGWGYNRASEVTDELERRGLIGPANGSGPRDIYMS